MTIIADINELNKIVRKYLIAQSEMPADRVRNALTTYGSTLDQLLQKQEFTGICPCDELMLFELRTRENDADVSMTEVDGRVTFDKSYTIYVIIYGDDAATIMNKLIARLRTQVVRESLLEEGVYVEKVQNDTSFNEFKNDVLWHRHDTEIHISCQMSIEQVSADNAFESIDPVTTIYKGDKNNE